MFIYKGIVPDLLDYQKSSKDADGLEATRAYREWMRTYSSTARWNDHFYDPFDPFCERRKPDDINLLLDFF